MAETTKPTTPVNDAARELEEATADMTRLEQALTKAKLHFADCQRKVARERAKTPLQEAAADLAVANLQMSQAEQDETRAQQALGLARQRVNYAQRHHNRLMLDARTLAGTDMAS
jgi:serine phosphatase RsbU (regulator of sigma subunit)